MNIKKLLTAVILAQFLVAPVFANSDNETKSTGQNTDNISSINNQSISSANIKEQLSNLFNQANDEFKKQNYYNALKLALKALEISKEQLGETDPYTIKLYYGISQIYKKLSDEPDSDYYLKLATMLSNGGDFYKKQYANLNKNDEYFITDRLDISKTIANVSLKEEKYSEAFDWLEEYLNIDHNQTDSKYKKNNFLIEKKVESVETKTNLNDYTIHDLRDKADNCFNLGKYNEAASWYIVFLENGKDIADASVNYAYLKLGNCYEKLNEPDKAIDAYKNYIKTVYYDSEKKWAKIEKEDIYKYNLYKDKVLALKILSHYEKGLKFEKNEDYLSAMKEFEISLEYKYKCEDKLYKQWHRKPTQEQNKLQKMQLIQPYYRLALILDNNNQYSQAMEWYDKLEMVLKEVAPTSDASFAHLYGNIAILNYKKEKEEAALNYLERAVLLYENLTSLSNTYIDSVKEKFQYKNLRKPVKYNKFQNNLSDRLTDLLVGNSVISSTDIGIFYSELNEFFKNSDSAILMYKSTIGNGDIFGGLSIITFNNDFEPISNNEYIKPYLKLADLYKRKGGDDNINLAMKYYMLALYQIANKTGKYNYETAAIYVKLGNLFFQKNDYERALKCADNSIKGIEETTVNSLSDTDKENLNQILRNSTELSINTLLKNNNSGKAFDYIEKSKARGIILNIASKNAKYNAGIALEDSEKQSQLEDNIKLNEIKLKKNDKDLNNEDRKQINIEIILLKNKLEEFKKYLDKKYPKYSELRYPKSISCDELKILFNHPDFYNTALIEYFIADDTLYIWCVYKNGIKNYSVSIKKDELKAKISAFSEELKKAGTLSVNEGFSDFIQKLKEYDPEKSAEVYNILLKPAEETLKNSDGTWKYKNLVIVPDGTLFNVPFDTLLTNSDYLLKEKDGVLLSEYQDLPYLAKQVSISYLPSASILKFMYKQDKNKIVKNNILLVSNPDGSLDSGKEEKTIEKIYAGNTSVLPGEKATEKNIRENYIGKYNNYHFSTHGYVNPKDPYKSFILLAKDDNSPENKEKGYDGKLYAYEVANIDINADTIVLAACSTASGKVSEGEGMIGLSRAFIISGTDTLLASLWNVNSQAASLITSNFYEDKLSNPKSQALKESKLKLINSLNQNISGLNYGSYKNISYSHPYFWAPIIIMGKWN